MTFSKLIGALCLGALLASCGGGGGSAGTSPLGTGGTTGTGTTTTATTADLLLTVSAAQLPNTGSGSVTVTATAVDASRNTLTNVPVALSVDGTGVLSSVSSANTGANGTVTASLGTGSDPSNRVLTVTAVSGAITKTATVQVVGTTVSAVLVPAVVAPGAAGQVQYRVADQAGNKMEGQAVQVVATGLNPTQASGTTDATGAFVFSYTAPATVGSFSVLTTVAGVTNQQTVTVQPASTVPAASIAILAASVSANPSVVAVNAAGSTSNQSEIRALFLGANNTPIPNVRAHFDLDGDVNSIGGTFTTGSGTLYSDANGVVTTSYVPGSRSSPTDGVTVRVCYGSSDTDPNLVNCTTSVKTTLTVTSEPLGVTIGTNGVIIVNTLTYVKQFVISVSDAAGVAKADVNLVASIDLPFYRKGFYAVTGKSWTKQGALSSGDAAICANEDTNRNGVLEAGEDVNNDGQLWPRKPDVTVSLLQSKTGSDGTAILQIQYAQDHGSWVDALITVSASGVAGSEGRATYLVAPVPVDAAAIANTAASPAFQMSPYGLASSCTNPH
ncbi:MAG: hypothetical protein M3O01_11405 [Pseudomonadota bacterium]|nr:hypothetical protein [Pseudomonadota bacterium]